MSTRNNSPAGRSAANTSDNNVGRREGAVNVAASGSANNVHSRAGEGYR